MAVFLLKTVGTGTLSQIWDAIFVYPYIPWFLVVVLALVVSMRVNAHEVSRFSSTSKERMLENQIQAIDAERKRQEKIILKLKTIEEEEEEGDEK
jgi:bacteriorhodopsin